MDEYYFSNEDFVKHEADIVLSGCIEGLQSPKMYESNNLKYWIYDSNYKNFENSTNEFQNAKNQINLIKQTVNDYMLRSENIVFHPKRISIDNKQMKFQYLPQKNKILYSSEDLVRWLDSDRNLMVSESNNNTKNLSDKNYLYFKDEGRLEQICFNNYTICRGAKCNIFADYDGKTLISPDGTLKILGGDIKINGIKAKKSEKINLEKGDLIKFGESLAVFW